MRGGARRDGRRPRTETLPQLDGAARSCAASDRKLRNGPRPRRTGRPPGGRHRPDRGRRRAGRQGARPDPGPPGRPHADPGAAAADPHARPLRGRPRGRLDHAGSPGRPRRSSSATAGCPPPGSCIRRGVLRRRAEHPPVRPVPGERRSPGVDLPLPLRRPRHRRAVRAAADRREPVVSRTSPRSSTATTSVGGVAADTDALFATGWETAYPAYRDPSPRPALLLRAGLRAARSTRWAPSTSSPRTPTGSASTASPPAAGWPTSWRPSTACAPTPSASAPTCGTTASRDTDRRNDIFFYARPVTTRRGFELGVMALAARRPRASGRDHPPRRLGHLGLRPPVPARQPRRPCGSPSSTSVYNQCAVALVLSLTNMSLLPLELLSSGVIPVLNRGPNNDKVVQNPFIRYADPSPRALADALVEEMLPPGPRTSTRARPRQRRRT